MRSCALVLVAVVAAACGGSRAQIEAERQRFTCRDRSASYVANHDLSGGQKGVRLDCAEAGPRITRWREGKAGPRQEEVRGLTPGQFDAIWKEIDGTGWPYMHDCANGSLGKHDPIYQFAIKDDQNRASFACQSQTMPYPYNDIVDPLDLAAQQDRKQLGDDEPAELKAREAQDKQH
jgi:hypothetical protein